MKPEMIANIMHASYSGAQELLQAAAEAMGEASKAAQENDRNLARGIAIGAEADLKRVLDLLAAVGALGQLGRA